MRYIRFRTMNETIVMRRLISDQLHKEHDILSRCRYSCSLHCTIITLTSFIDNIFYFYAILTQCKMKTSQTHNPNNLKTSQSHNPNNLKTSQSHNPKNMSDQ